MHFIYNEYALTHNKFVANRDVKNTVAHNREFLIERSIVCFGANQSFLGFAYKIQSFETHLDWLNHVS